MKSILIISRSDHCISCKLRRNDDSCSLQSDEANLNAKTWEDLRSQCPLKEVTDEYAEKILKEISDNR